MQVIVATVSSRLLILRRVAFFFPLFNCDETLSIRGMGYYALPGLTWTTSGVRAIDLREDLRIYLRVACVAPAPLSTGACALPCKNAMAMLVGTPLIRTILHVTGASVPGYRKRQRNIVVKALFSSSSGILIELKYAMVTVFFIGITADEAASIS